MVDSIRHKENTPALDTNVAKANAKPHAIESSTFSSPSQQTRKRRRTDSSISSDSIVTSFSREDGATPHLPAGTERETTNPTTRTFFRQQLSAMILPSTPEIPPIKDSLYSINGASHWKELPRDKSMHFPSLSPALHFWLRPEVELIPFPLPRPPARPSLPAAPVHLLKEPIGSPSDSLPQKTYKTGLEKTPDGPMVLYVSRQNWRLGGYAANWSIQDSNNVDYEKRLERLVRWQDHDYSHDALSVRANMNTKRFEEQWLHVDLPAYLDEMAQWQKEVCEHDFRCLQLAYHATGVTWCAGRRPELPNSFRMADVCVPDQLVSLKENDWTALGRGKSNAFPTAGPWKFIADAVIATLNASFVRVMANGCDLGLGHTEPETIEGGA